MREVKVPPCSKCPLTDLNRTIAVSPTNPGDYPCFVVNDLTKDDRFNQLPFVTGTPFLRFYAGVPLITKRGIPIGSLFIVDDRVWHGLEKDHVRFMGTMAKTIMKHLEMVREVEEHRRGMKMSRGLASFVEGRAELVEAEIEAEGGEGIAHFSFVPRISFFRKLRLTLHALGCSLRYPRQYLGCLDT